MHIVQVFLAYLHYYYTHLVDIFQDNLGKPVPER